MATIPDGFKSAPVAKQREVDEAMLNGRDLPGGLRLRFRGGMQVLVRDAAKAAKDAAKAAKADDDAADGADTNG